VQEKLRRGGTSTIGRREKDASHVKRNLTLKQTISLQEKKGASEKIRAFVLGNGNKKDMKESRARNVSREGPITVRSSGSEQGWMGKPADTEK